MALSSLGGLIIELVAIITALFGAIFLVLGVIVSVFSFQLWIFATAGVSFMISSVGWHILKVNKYRYYVNREALKKWASEHQQK